MNTRGETPAICVPVFSHPPSNQVFLQAIGYDHKVLSMEVLRDEDDQQIQSNFFDESYVKQDGEAIYWISLGDIDRATLIGRHRTIKRELLRYRSVIAAMDNPFERLDFAQLSENPHWFSDEALQCEGILSKSSEKRRTDWLEHELLRGRVQFALETIAFRRGISVRARQHLKGRLSLELRNGDVSVDVAPPSDLISPDMDELRHFVREDVVCQYARRRLTGGPALSLNGAAESTNGAASVSSGTDVIPVPVVPSGWWQKPSDLDPEQTKAYQLPLDGNYLILGPPGSGKTNVLVLRASYVASTGQNNVRLLTYTRVSREFIASGCGDHINFPADQVMTIAGWINEFLNERGVDRPDTRNMDEEEAWHARLAALRAAAEGVQDFYDSLIVDEVQDLPGELVGIMSNLTSRLFMAGDTNQRIFEKDAKDSGINTARDIADMIVTLKYHYRIGQNICVAAERLLKSTDSLIATCRYNSQLGSRVEVHHINGLEAQCAELASRLVTQIRTYGRDGIGVITARRETRDRIYELLRGTPVGELTKIMASDADEPWYDEERPISIMTLQAAKGSEFRAVHWIEADNTPFFTRQKAYVITTRAKSSLDVYYSKRLQPSLSSAFAQLVPPKPPF